MNKILTILLFGLLFNFQALSQAMAGDVHVRGYTRADGTYVRPHVRSAPDSSLSNNYGPSETSRELMNPGLRDHDNDGISNSRDRDDDNDGVSDDSDRSQYGR